MNTRELRLALLRASREPFITTERMQDLDAQLVAHDYRPGAARRHLPAHLPKPCPGCGVDGYFRWGFLGRFSHPACAHKWVVPPWRYLAHHGGGSVADTASLAFDPVTAMQTGVFETVVTGCLFGLFRVAIAFLLLPAQTVLWLCSR